MSDVAPPVRGTGEINMHSILLERTLHLVRNRSVKITLKKISEDTGLKYDWLVRFNMGNYDDCGVKKVETLYNYLSADKLTLPDLQEH